MSSATAEAVRQLLASERFGVLCTLQQARKAGWPMPSLAPYALTAEGEPILAMSALAQHTKNAAADARAALYVAAPGQGDPQERGRAAVLGRIRRAAEVERADLQARYLAAHPEAAPFFQLDFALYVLAVEEVRWVGGFAAAAWVSGSEVVGA